MPAEHKLRYVMGTIVSLQLVPAPLQQRQMDSLLTFVHHVMMDHAGRTAYWRERRVQVDWQFGEDGALDLNVSTSVGTGLGQEDQVVVVD